MVVGTACVLTKTKPQLTKKKMTEKIRHQPGCVQNICRRNTNTLLVQVNSCL